MSKPKLFLFILSGCSVFSNVIHTDKLIEAFEEDASNKRHLTVFQEGNIYEINKITKSIE